MFGRIFSVSLMLSISVSGVSAETIDIDSDWSTDVIPVETSNNVVNVGNENTPISGNNKIYAGYSIASGVDASNNTLNFFGNTHLTNPTDTSYGIYSLSGNTNNNKINIGGNVIADSLIYVYSSAGNARYNTINLRDNAKVLNTNANVWSGGVDINSYYGEAAYNVIDVADNAEVHSTRITSFGAIDGHHNIVNVYNNAVVDFVIEGHNVNSGSRQLRLASSYNNTVNIFDNAVVGRISGAYVSSSWVLRASSYNNTVNIFGNATVNADIQGGFSGGDIISSVQHHSYNNTINIADNAEVTGNIRAGEVAGSGNAYGNVVNLSGNAIIIGDVVGGYVHSGSSGSSYDNIINISNQVNLENTTIYGGLAHTDAQVHDNTVNFNNFSGKVYDIKGTKTTNVNGSDVTFTNTSVVLEDLNNNGLVNLSGDNTANTLIMDNYSGNGILKIDVGAGVTDLIVINSSVNSAINLVLNPETSARELSNDIASNPNTYKVLSVLGSMGESVNISNIGVYKYGTEKFATDWYLASSVFDKNAGELYGQSQLSGLASLNASLDMVHGMIPVAVRNVQYSKQGASAFVGGTRHDTDYTTGSHINVDGWSTIVGVAKNVSEKAIAGVFLEYGKGDYAAYNVYQAKGETEHYGFGLLGQYRYDRYNNVEGTVRLGRQKRDFNGYGIGSYFNDSQSYYWATSLGNNWDAYDCNNHSVVVNNTIYYTHLDGDKKTDNLGQRIDIKDTDSLRYRFGLRYGYYFGLFKPYIGVAEEYELLGDGKSKIDGYKSKTASLQGFTTILETGINVLEYENISIDANLQRYFGVREDWSGNIYLQYSF